MTVQEALRDLFDTVERMTTADRDFKTRYFRILARDHSLVPLTAAEVSDFLERNDFS